MCKQFFQLMTYLAHILTCFMYICITAFFSFALGVIIVSKCFKFELHLIHLCNLFPSWYTVNF